jgi:archaemetzincin
MLRYFLTMFLLMEVVTLSVGCRQSTRGPGTSMNISVIIIPIGDLEPEDLEYMAEQLKAKFGNCTVGDEMDMPTGAYNPQRGQYMSGILLQRLLEAYPEAPTGTKILGVTDEDLYSPGLNFVFGQAQMGGQCAVISLKRLDPAFYGMRSDVGIFRYRMMKEAVHELGHTLGLEHCSNRLCVMHFSNSLRDTDVKKDWFCKRCLARLGWN